MDRLVPLVYGELRGVAHRQLEMEREGHTLGTTALVHEAYLKLADLDRLNWRNRAQFFAIAAGAMRRILVDHAARRTAQKRGGGAVAVPLSEVALTSKLPAPDDLLALDQALRKLEAENARACRVVEYRVFAGMTIAQAASVLGVSAATVERDWALARAYLNRLLS